MNSEKGLRFHSVENPQIGSSFLRLHKSSVFRPVILTLYTIMLSLTISGLLPTTTVADGKACVRETEYEVCSKDEICSYGQCVTGCRTTAQCPQGQGCLDNKCTTMICSPGYSQSCYEGKTGKSVGICREGIQICLSNGRTFSPCFNQVLPQQEICDRKDNDCDGSIDEEITCECEPGTKRACYTGPQNTHDVGECRGGLQYCEKGYSWGKCAEQKRPSLEICDQKDNDCDGQVDEDVNCECKPGAIKSCYTHDPATAGIGECHDGKQVCQMDNTWFDGCFEEQGPVSETMTNNKDNNCDGEIDNVFVDPNPQILDTPVIIDSEPKPQLEIIE